MKHAKTLSSLALALTTLVTLVAAPSRVQAQQLAYVSKEVNLRAGPSSDYPVVAILGAGVTITVEGCMSDYRWCDVSIGPNRGWLYAGNIVYPYQGANVPLLTYGPAIGIGVVAFSVGHYWDDYYRASPWYPQRQRWIERHPSVPYPVPYSVPYPAPYPVVRPGFHHPPQPQIAVPLPAPRPPHSPRPGFDRPPPPGVRPVQGTGHGREVHGPAIQGQPEMPRAHHGMRRHEGQRPGEAQGSERR